VKPILLVRTFQILSGIMLGLAVALWFLGRGGGRIPVSEASHFLPEPLEAPLFTLTSHQGAVVHSTDWPGRVLVVFFGYTSCPDVCPLTLTHLTRAFQIMGEDGGQVQVLFVTVDPERDTPQRLREYLASFHPSYLGLTGTEEEIREVALEFGVFFARSGEGEGYTVDHTARTFVVAPDGTIPLTFPVTATPEEMARDLSALLSDDDSAPAEEEI